MTVNDSARATGRAERIAVTGATGFIGSYLTRSLEARGHTVLRIGRGTSAVEKVDVVWDPARGTLDARALEGVDAVVHLAGASISDRWTRSHRARIRTSRVDGTTLLARTLAQLQSKPRVLVSGSAIGFYGSRGSELLDESSAPGDGYLAEVTREWESCTSAAQRANIRVVHARTGLVQHRSGGALAKMLPFFRAGLGGPIAGGRAWMSSIALDDHVRALMFLLEQEHIHGAVNLVAPAPVTNAEYTRVLGALLERPVFWPIPAFALRLLYGGEMMDNTVLASARVVPSVLLGAGFQFRHANIESVMRFALGELPDPERSNN